ncbi:helix-turn-helix domain-containing protein [Catenulispora yoronensis]|uniref:Helix-turn-helix domain-containing protein n=1 Tax=Catenulispora yoronensis TaxID=450799 RepID=A0ABP5GUZ1_9ACTN
MVSGEQTTDADTAALATVMLDRAVELGDGVAARLVARIPAYRSLVDYEGLRHSCHEHVRVIFGDLAGVPYTGPDAAVNTGRTRAAEGVPMSAIYDGYQIAVAYLWEELADAAQHSRTTPAAAIRASSELWMRLQGFTATMSETYRAEMEDRIRSQEQRRSALVQALLEGSLAEPQVWDVADLLRLPHQGPYVVIAARVAGIGEHALTGIENKLDALGIGSAWRLMHDVEIGVASLPRPRDQFDQLIAGLDSGGLARVGVSPLYDNLTTTSNALRLARIALRGAVGAGDVVVFGDDPLTMAVASAPDVMPRLADTILAGLQDMPLEDRTLLLETFGVWRDTGGSAEAAARRLYVHPNTVRYRLKRLEERTGRSLTDPRHLAELSLAYEIDRSMGSVN